MLKYLPNMPACHIGIGQDSRGPNNTITLGDVSTLSALAEAVRIVERHQADLIIAGGVDSLIHPAQWMRCQILGLSRCRDPRATPRPFDARDGRVNGEGAAAFAIETRVSAQARAARRWPRSSAMARSFAPPVAGQPQPAAIGRAIAAALREAGLGPGDVGLVVAHAYGTVEGDRIEAEAIRAALDDVPVTAPKSFSAISAPPPARWKRPWPCCRSGTGSCLRRSTTSSPTPGARSTSSVASRPHSTPHRHDPQPLAPRPGGGRRAGRRLTPNDEGALTGTIRL